MKIRGIKPRRQEINRLTKEQVQTLSVAVYLGMTPDEAKEYDDRHQHIRQLVEEVAMLERAQMGMSKA
jgi:uncharacterized protein YeaC (DUF1315 family)